MTYLRIRTLLTGKFSVTYLIINVAAGRILHGFSHLLLADGAHGYSGLQDRYALKCII
jgi:hypothetical protein